MRRLRVLPGMSIFWLDLSMLADGLTTLELPDHLLGVTNEGSKARRLSLLTSVGLLAPAPRTSLATGTVKVCSR